MGACISEDNTLPQSEIKQPTIRERHISLVEFVRALSAPNVQEKPSNVITSIADLTTQQEEFLSKYKMTIYSNSSDVIRVSSTFSIIEDEFYDKFNKQISRDTLYELYNIP